MPIGERSNSRYSSRSLRRDNAATILQQQRVFDLVERTRSPARRWALACEQILGLGEHGLEIDEPAVWIDGRSGRDRLREHDRWHPRRHLVALAVDERAQRHV